MKVLDGLKYSKEHEWVKVVDNRLTGHNRLCPGFSGRDRVC